jgi:NAD(P) transhydrogenase subunit alpha
MAPGSVILDLASERGGNCELTRPGETVIVHGVTIIGAMNMAGTAPYHSSQVYARNLTSFLQNLVKDGQVRPAESDDIIRDTLLTKDGEVVNARVREMLGLPVAVVSGREQ